MKSHTGFQLVSKSVTLTDLERRKDDRRVSGIAEFAGLEFAGLENDGRTDRILTDRPRLHSMQRCKNALLTVSLFWDCCRFWSFGLSCYLAVKFSLRSFGAPLYARRPGHLSLPPLATPLSWIHPHIDITIRLLLRVYFWPTPGVQEVLQS